MIEAAISLCPFAFDTSKVTRSTAPLRLADSRVASIDLAWLLPWIPFAGFLHKKAQFPDGPSLVRKKALRIEFNYS